MRRSVAVVLLSFLSITCFAQVNTGLLKTLSAVAGMRDRLPIEKVYLQLDKPYYLYGDTLRFKAYIVNGDGLRPSVRSGILYVVINNAANRMLKLISVPITSGMSSGSVVLDGKEMLDGGIVLRAFTNWILNFDEDYIFKKDIYVSPLNKVATLVNADFKLEDIGNKDKVSVGLQLSTLSGDPLRLRDIRLKLGTTYRWLFNNQVSTGMDGRMRLNFILSDKTTTKDLYIEANEVTKGTNGISVIIPVTLNRPEKTDLQFMPEGGNIIAGMPSKIAFKALGEDGKGATVSGKVFNRKQQEVAQFAATHKGMGSFEFTPLAGDSYTAKVNVPGGPPLNFSLPGVKTTGTALRVIPKGADSLTITLNQTTDLVNKPTSYYLIAQTRGLICYSALINFKGTIVTKIIAKNLFPAGIAHFTLLNNANQPLNERIAYIGHEEVLKVTLTVDKPKYTLRDSVNIAITVKDKLGKPVESSFSLAVTDDSQVKTDSAKNIVSHLLLTSDLKGNIEDPAWYFEKDTQDRSVALDNLLLTQGWIGYDWKTTFGTEQRLLHQAEPEFVVQGKLTNVFNAPLKHTTITLLQKQPFLALETQTNDNGMFIFKNKSLLPTDSAYYLVQVRHKNGENRDFNVGLELDVPALPTFHVIHDRAIPWYFNTDTTLLNYNNTKIIQQQAEADYRGEGNLLKEVIIKSTKIIPDSFNLNGPGGSDMSFNETDMNKEKSRTLVDMLRHQFKDFHGEPTIDGDTIYFLGNQKIIFFIDGIPGQTSLMPTSTVVNWFSASDIKGIEIMTTDPYTLNYYNKMRIPFTTKIAFIEITTFSGLGPFIKHKAGRYVYKPIGLTFPKQFYSPKYTVANKAAGMGIDLRSTIYWEPNIVTDKDGKATVSFFCADKPSNYTLILEGTDLKGAFGYSREKIKVLTH